MIVAIAMFLTFMVTSISLYTYFTKNPIVITSNNKITKNKKWRKKLWIFLWKWCLILLV